MALEASPGVRVLWRVTRRHRWSRVPLQIPRERRRQRPHSRPSRVEEFREQLIRVADLSLMLGETDQDAHRAWPELDGGANAADFVESRIHPPLTDSKGCIAEA